ncbi:hypothetical protein O9X81_00025 [Agrobacterium salinitolerans]|uniref:hypothetical protein n=1 Tax=Agrobacterium salinitolerans TaxID=1183413 RepID=UPI0022B82604|nr:hypothetical protein [Agrobacterium salinitolerans]MCZ7854994.1 hypothetical protein [Agrobacterium salinitolerans]
MTTAIQPAAWRVSMGTTADHNYWHYFGKKPKAIDDGEIWEPLYSASTLESLQRENEELRQRLGIGPCGEDAIDVAESAAGHLRHRAEAADAEVKRLRGELSFYSCDGSTCDCIPGQEDANSVTCGFRARTALASTGGEHHGN